MPKDYTEYTEDEIKKLIAKAHDVPVVNVTLTHHIGSGPDVPDLYSRSPSVSARVLLVKS